MEQKEETKDLILELMLLDHFDKKGVPMMKLEQVRGPG